MKKAVKKATRIAKAAPKKADGAAGVTEKIAQWPEPFRAVGERLHEIIMKSAPGLAPRVRYGMPWYMKDGKSCCFFRVAPNFGFVTFGFDDPAIVAQEERVAHGLIASAYRITALDEATEKMLSAIVRKVAG